MARTDALAVEGIEAAIERAVACVEAGADMIFPEAMQTLDDYRRFKAAVKVPILANITEFGSTPILHATNCAKRRRHGAVLLRRLSRDERRRARMSMRQSAATARRRLPCRNDADAAGLFKNLFFTSTKSNTRCSPHKK